MNNQLFSPPTYFEYSAMTRERKQAVLGLLHSNYQGILSSANLVLNIDETSGATLGEYAKLLRESGLINSPENLDQATLPTKDELTSRVTRMLDFLDDVGRYEKDPELRMMAGEVYGLIQEYSIE